MADTAKTNSDGLRRLTDVMNGREYDPEGRDLIEPMPYSQEFVRALLSYSHGGAGEAETLAAIGVDDPSVLSEFVGQLTRAVRTTGMNDDMLAELSGELHVGLGQDGHGGVTCCTKSSLS